MAARAISVINANWTGRSTIPAPGLYPHQWNWDSAFIAIGLSHVHQERARTELEALFRGQWPSGMLPHIVFNPAVRPDAYVPGPDFWRCHSPFTATSGITQPPLQALAALMLYRNSTGSADSAEGEATRGFLRTLYPRLVAQHAYLAHARDLAGDGLACIVHPWESGLDNSPAWDEPLARVELPGVLPAYRRRDLSHVPSAQRPTAADYDRYLYLAAHLRATGYDDHRLYEHPFLVEDPLFNAVYLASTHALAEIAALVGADPAPHRAAARRIHAGLLDALWDGAEGFFFPRDVRTGKQVRVRAIGGFAPLLDPDLPAAVVDTLEEELRRYCAPVAHPVPSCDPADLAFDRLRYWRGPVWVNVNWLLWRALAGHGRAELAELIRTHTLRLVAEHGFREYFDPLSGTGYGARSFSWSAALTLDLLAADTADLMPAGAG